MLLYLWVWSSVGVAHHGVANPVDALHVLSLARPAGSVLACLRVICSRSGCLFCSSVDVAWRCQLPYGRLVHCWACCAAANVGAAVLVGRGAGSWFVCDP